MHQNERDSRLQSGMNVHYPTVNEDIHPHPLTYYYYNNNTTSNGANTPLQHLLPQQQQQQMLPQQPQQHQTIPIMQMQQYYPTAASTTAATTSSTLPLLERPPSENGLTQRRLEDNKSTNTSSVLSGQSLMGSLGIDGMTADSISRSTSPAFANKLGPSTYTYPAFQQQQGQGHILHPVPTNSRDTVNVNAAVADAAAATAAAATATGHPLAFSSTSPLHTRDTLSRESHHSNTLIHSPRLTRADWDTTQQNMGIVQSYDIVNDSGQQVPRVTTTMWEDESTLCYQVKANGVSVVRRADNDMINGTKLLNVTKMTRGKRDGILKAEKIRHVVKIGSMHLKGVWIPFERALVMAEREQIVGLLYPLFVRDIDRVLRGGERPPSATAAITNTVPATASTTATTTSQPIISRPASRTAYQPSHTPVSTSTGAPVSTSTQLPMHMHMPLPLPLPLPPVSMSNAQLPLALSMQTALPPSTSTTPLHNNNSNSGSITASTTPAPTFSAQQLHLQQLHTQHLMQQQQIHQQQQQVQQQVQQQQQQQQQQYAPLPQQLTRNVGQLAVGIRPPQPSTIQPTTSTNSSSGNTSR